MELVSTRSVAAKYNSGGYDEDPFPFDWDLFFTKFDRMCDVEALRWIMQSFKSPDEMRKFLLAALDALPEQQGCADEEKKDLNGENLSEFERSSSNCIENNQPGVTAYYTSPDSRGPGNVSSEFADPLTREEEEEKKKTVRKISLMKLNLELVALYRHGIVKQVGVEEHPHVVIHGTYYLLADFGKQWTKQSRFWSDVEEEIIVAEDGKSYTMICKALVDAQKHIWQCWVVVDTLHPKEGLCFYTCYSNMEGSLNIGPMQEGPKHGGRRSGRKQKKEQRKGAVFGPHR